jgi:nucleotide-binding universal stress UspA family protein
MHGGTIICGVSDAPGSRDAADLAHALGARLGLRLVLVSVVDGIAAGTDESLSARQRQTGAERTVRTIADELGEAPETRVVYGPRADTLAQVAAEEGADLIVVGSRSAGLGGRKLRCSLARELEAATSVPVVVAPPATRRRDDHRLSPAGSRGRRSSESVSR